MDIKTRIEPISNENWEVMKILKHLNNKNNPNTIQIIHQKVSK